MLTNLRIRNFRRFADVDIELGSPVIFIGPNNSGKSTALQALALWDIGLRRWSERRGGKSAPEKRPGVTINRRDLITVPVPDANLLWRDLHVRTVDKVEGKQRTDNVYIEIIVQGVDRGKVWKCGLEFYYANPESFYCRPLRTSADTTSRMPIPDAANHTNIAFLPPMSGLASNETRLDQGAINVRLGEGRTAEVLRNLCYHIASQEGEGDDDWQNIVNEIQRLFGDRLSRPEYIAERGEITMTYETRENCKLDLSCSGRGLQQTLLLLAHLAANPGSVLLLDEPDAHLEILRQRQIYTLLTRMAERQGSQIIAASHSEVVLNQAADQHMVVAFVGRPHRIDDRGSQLVKSLKEIGFEDYYQAEQRGWVLYAEGSTDAAILAAFARKLDHPASEVLENAFFVPIGNQASVGKHHFHGLREAKTDLTGYMLLDQDAGPVEGGAGLDVHTWHRREIENYLCQPETLERYAVEYDQPPGDAPLFGELTEKRRSVMRECIRDLVPPIALRDREHSWWFNTKVSDEFLNQVFSAFFQRLEEPNRMSKSNYHALVPFVPDEKIDPEVRQVLDDIVDVEKKASPRNQ